MCFQNMSTCSHGINAIVLTLALRQQQVRSCSWIFSSQVVRMCDVNEVKLGNWFLWAVCLHQTFITANMLMFLIISTLQGVFK